MPPVQSAQAAKPPESLGSSRRASPTLRPADSPFIDPAHAGAGRVPLVGQRTLPPELLGEICRVLDAHGLIDFVTTCIRFGRHQIS